MTSCPSDEQVADLLADTLSIAERDTLARHVEGCASCQEKLARWTATPDASRWQSAPHPTFSPDGRGKGERDSEAEDSLMRRLKQMPPWSASKGAQQVGRPAGDSLQAGDSMPAGTDLERPRVPGYEILSELGRGGMGVVYKARQVALQRTVALKMLLTGSHAGPKDVARFRAEAAAIARLQHPNIVQIYDVGEAAGRPYFALEFVPSGSLAQHLQGTPQPVRLAAQMIETLARAVHAAHASGVIHRDLKPANILLAGVRGQGPRVREGRTDATSSLTPDP